MKYIVQVNMNMGTEYVKKERTDTSLSREQQGGTISTRYSRKYRRVLVVLPSACQALS